MTDEFAEALESLALKYQNVEYIEHDPIAIPHGFDSPEDREIIGLFAALLAWGRRSTILAKMNELCERMNYRPADFIRHFNPATAEQQLAGFKHRTFTEGDALWTCANLSSLLHKYGSLENCWASYGQRESTIEHAIEGFSSEMMAVNPDTPARLKKHLARPSTGSACKRLCMFARWMVRPGPFDLGLWTAFKTHQIVMPLDVHSGKQARSTGLLRRNANDWKAALELTDACRKLDEDDPCKYDFALFGAGVYGGLEEFV